MLCFVWKSWEVLLDKHEEDWIDCPVERRSLTHNLFIPQSTIYSNIFLLNLSRFIAKSILRTARGRHIIRIPGALAALSQCNPLHSRVGARPPLADLLGPPEQSTHSVTAGDLPSAASNLSHLQQSTHDASRRVGPHERPDGARCRLQSTDTFTGSPERAN